MAPFFVSNTGLMPRFFRKLIDTCTPIISDSLDVDKVVMIAP
jgi:hypothetical protein